jgi:Flp pilus assembly protein CpaB
MPDDSKAAIVLLQNVLVLASGTYTSPRVMAAEKDAKTRTPLREQGLTLSLNVQEVELVSLASAVGQFSVALRGAGDPRTNALAPDVTAAGVVDKRSRTAALGKRVPGSPVRLVETPAPFPARANR